MILPTINNCIAKNKIKLRFSKKVMFNIDENSKSWRDHVWDSLCVNFIQTFTIIQ